MTTVLVSDEGFVSDPWREDQKNRVIISVEDISNHGARNDPRIYGLDVPNSIDPAVLEGLFEHVELIRIPFPSFADGRGFSIARKLRELGYTGTLRAFGHVLADQYALARRSGFDEVEIHSELAKRQPEEQWKSHSNVQNETYQHRLGVLNSKSGFVAQS